MTKERFAQLPMDVQDKVKNTLKAYDNAYIIFEYGEYHVSVGIALKAHYAEDHKVIGTVNVDDIFTKEEKIINYAESFHEFSPLYKGKRDYRMMNEVGNDWNAKFKFEDGVLVRA